MQIKQNKIKGEGDFKSITVCCVLDYPEYPSRNTKTEWQNGMALWVHGLGLEGNSEQNNMDHWIY